MRNIVNIWTDGSCNNGTGEKGGYGVVMEFTDASTGKKFKVEYFGGQYTNTTSPRMELLGVISALRRVTPNYKCLIHCDNKYVVDGLMKGWVFKWEEDNWRAWDKKTGEWGLRSNMDLWKEFLEQYRRFPKNHIQLKWVRGHASNKGNIRADYLASLGAKKRRKIVDRQ